MSNEINIREKSKSLGEVFYKHMLRMQQFSYPLLDQLLTQLFTELEEGAVNVDIISQIVNDEELSFTIKTGGFHQISIILETLKNQIKY